MYRSDFALFYLIKDIYWCFIPLYCRDCSFLEQCRKGFFHWRKCYNGCIKGNFERRLKREEEQQDYLDNLMEYCEELEKKGKMR